MQADPNVAEASQSPQPLSPQLEPLLSEIVGSATLTEQCNRCSRNLDACIRSIGTVARTLASTLDKTKLVSIEARLEEHRIRFEIWKSDCNVSNGSLSTIHNEQEASLYGLVDALFNNFNEACRSLHESIARILLNRSLQAEQRPLEETCDKLTQLIHRLAELQPSVQMAQAIHQGKGPYSNLYRGVSDIREKYKDQSSEFAPEEGSEFANDDLSSRTSGDEQCRKCKRWMPFHALAFHEDSCQGTVEVPDEASASASVSGSEAVASVDMDADILIEESPSKGDKRRRQSKSSIAFHAQMSRAPQGYAFAVKQHSRRKLQNSLYPGSNYSAFANHLHRGITDRGKNQRRPSLLKSKATMTCYTYSEKNPPEKRNFFAHSGLTELSLFLQSRGENCVIILGGNVSPSILNTLGTSCSIDPEFFRRHLNLEKSDFSTPTLPSVPTNMFKLRYTTIGVRSQPTLPPYELDQNSDDLSTDLHRQFRWQREMGCHGESIIRRLHIYDDEYVSIEQDISLYSKTSDTSRVGWFGKFSQSWS